MWVHIFGHVTSCSYLKCKSIMSCLLARKALRLSRKSAAPDAVADTDGKMSDHMLHGWPRKGEV